MKARVLFFKGKLITVWNGEADIAEQVRLFVKTNQQGILSNIDYHEGGWYDVNIHNSPFYEYEITISGDNGVMEFDTMIFDI